nr:hypothetical protein CFP56_41494 [Quercus suber]
MCAARAALCHAGMLTSSRAGKALGGKYQERDAIDCTYVDWDLTHGEPLATVFVEKDAGQDSRVLCTGISDIIGRRRERYGLLVTTGSVAFCLSARPSTSKPQEAAVIPWTPYHVIVCKFILANSTMAAARPYYLVREASEPSGHRWKHSIVTIEFEQISDVSDRILTSTLAKHGIVADDTRAEWAVGHVLGLPSCARISSYAYLSRTHVPISVGFPATPPSTFSTSLGVHESIPAAPGSCPAPVISSQRRNDPLSRGRRLQVFFLPSCLALVVSQSFVPPTVVKRECIRPCKLPPSRLVWPPLAHTPMDMVTIPGPAAAAAAARLHRVSLAPAAGVHLVPPPTLTLRAAGDRAAPPRAVTPPAATPPAAGDRAALPQAATLPAAGDQAVPPQAATSPAAGHQVVPPLAATPPAAGHQVVMPQAVPRLRTATLYPAALDQADTSLLAGVTRLGLTRVTRVKNRHLLSQ